MDQTVIHKLFGHAGKHVMARTTEAYGLKLPSGVHENCESCDVANLQRNPTTSLTRNPDQPIVGLWEVDLPSRMPPGDRAEYNIPSTPSRPTSAPCTPRQCEQRG